MTFIVGLDDSRFPGAGLQDPLLLDHERQAPAVVVHRVLGFLQIGVW